MPFNEILEKYRKIIDKILNDYLNIKIKQIDNSSDDFIHFIYAALKEYILNGGKRLRPCALIMAYEAVNNDPEDIFTASLSTELLHNSTLIHDDIMDEDDYRRGKSSINKIIKDFYFRNYKEKNYEGNLFNKNSSRFAVTHSICAGNILFSLGSSAIIDTSFKPNLVKRALKAYSEAYRIINEGQITDNFLELKNDVLERHYYNMIIGKTAKLFETSICIGAILGNASEQIIQALSVFAINAGIIFQLQDDIMDLDPNLNKGHVIGSDIRKGKHTLIIIKGLENSNYEEKKFLNQTLGNENASESDIISVMDILTRTGAINYVKTFAQKKLDDCRKSLDSVKISKRSLDFFNGFADYMIDRII